MDINDIQKLTSGIIRRNEPMSAHTSFRVGGAADYYIIPDNAGEIPGLIRLLKRRDVPFTVIGNGTNLLVSDKGYRGVIIELGHAEAGGLSRMELKWDGDTLIMDVGAGCLMSSVGKAAANAGGTGFEALSGIPGCIGGACVMNAGAFGSEMKDVVRSVDAVDAEGSLVRLDSQELGFRYRGSRLMDDGMIVCGARIVLQKGNADEIRRRSDELLEQRRLKQPLEYPSAGSTFKRPEGYFAGKLISDAGLKGCFVGGAMVSEKHAGFIINTGEATAADIMALIRKVQAEVYRQFNVRLEPEVRFMGEFD